MVYSSIASYTSLPIEKVTFTMRGTLCNSNSCWHLSKDEQLQWHCVTFLFNRLCIRFDARLFHDRFLLLLFNVANFRMSGTLRNPNSC